MAETDTHTYIHTYIHTHVHTYREAIARRSERKMAEADTHTYIHKYIHTYREAIARRSEREMADAETESLVKVVKQMITVLDTLELSRQNLKSNTEAEANIIAEYCKVEDQLLDTLKAKGIETVQALGLQFDPNLHEAVQQKESDLYVEGVVCVQYQRGYRLGQKLIRPATVVVSAGPGPSVAAPVQQEPAAVAAEVSDPVQEFNEPAAPVQEVVESVTLHGD
jgi:molecular chaperone GrpE (heat shock protein)